MPDAGSNIHGAFFSTTCNCQSDTITADSIMQSSEYKQICSIVPKNWNVNVKGNVMNISSSYKLWFFNCINMPAFLDSIEYDAFAKERGFYFNYTIRLEFTERWTDQKLKRYEKMSDSIQKYIYSLPTKYKLHNLPHKFDSYIGMNDQDDRRVTAYENEKSVLNNEMEKYRQPELNSRHFSMFISDDRSSSDCVYPNTNEPELLFEKLIEMFGKKQPGK